MAHKLFEIIKILENQDVYFSLSRQRNDSVMISCTLVGARIEIDVFEDTHIEYSVFLGNESVSGDESKLLELVRTFSN